MRAVPASPLRAGIGESARCACWRREMVIATDEDGSNAPSEVE
jgi:hypothetical protein